MPNKNIFLIVLFILSGCEVKESTNIYTPPDDIKYFENTFEAKVFNERQINLIKINLESLLDIKEINLKKPIALNIERDHISRYIDCGYMNKDKYVDYIEKIFGSSLEAKIYIDLEENSNDIIFEKFKIEYIFRSKETGTRWKFSTNKPKDLLVGNPVYSSNPYRKCLSKNILENEVVDLFK
tara:strand:+ start:2612 stop:3157 length:546 start_codon:yes stop_codon:yes gene_type:complete